MPDRSSESKFRPAWFAANPHLQTLWGKFAKRPLDPRARVERWDTPDGDWIELHRLDAPSPERPRLLLLHGLEGNIRSHYVGGILDGARRRGWGAELLVFRGCGAEMNRASRMYHSGETGDAAFVLARLAEEFPRAPLGLAGVSLGGNVLLKLLGERGAGAATASRVRGAAAVSVPFDLERGCRYIARGFARVYEQNFLRSLRAKAAAKLARYPGLFDDAAMRRARTLYDFDDVVTAPIHGFRDAHDYYSRSSSLQFLDRIRVPTLLLSAVDDPFLPPAVLEEVRAVAAGNPCLELEFTPRGGHVGFVEGRVPWRPAYYAERRVLEFLETRLEGTHPRTHP